MKMQSTHNGLHEAMPKAFTVGPFFPQKNRVAADKAIADTRKKQAKQGRIILVTTVDTVAGKTTIKQVVKKVKKKQGK